MTRHLENLRAVFALVFARFSYIALAAMLSVLAFLLGVWFPNLGLIAEIFSGSNAPLTTKLGIAFSLLGGIGTNFSPLSAGYTVAISVLFGITAAMIIYLLRRTRVTAAGKTMAIGSGGVASGVVGIGCAACGSLIVGAVLPSFGAAGALAALLLGGEEFGILSVALLLVSLLLISRKIAEPDACSVAQPRNARQP